MASISPVISTTPWEEKSPFRAQKSRESAPQIKKIFTDSQIHFNSTPVISTTSWEEKSPTQDGFPRDRSSTLPIKDRDRLLRVTCSGWNDLLYKLFFRAVPAPWHQKSHVSEKAFEISETPLPMKDRARGEGVVAESRRERSVKSNLC